MFDYYDADNFKFVSIIAGTNQVVFGHYSKGNWSIDAVASLTIEAGTEYDLSLSLKGTTASLLVNGQSVLGAIYNAAVVDGQSGLFAEGGDATFSGYTMKTDDPQFRDEGGVFETPATELATPVTLETISTSTDTTTEPTTADSTAATVATSEETLIEEPVVTAVTTTTSDPAPTQVKGRGKK